MEALAKRPRCDISAHVILARPLAHSCACRHFIAEMAHKNPAAVIFHPAETSLTSQEARARG